MKKLFLKSGLSIHVFTSEDETGKYICICDEADKETLLFSVFKGRAVSKQSLIFVNPCEDIALWDIMIVAEVNENFNQYFNQLSQ
jgi:superfamily II DNA/RNA helicase